MKFSTALLLAAVALPTTANATGLATCDSGPESGWQPQEKLSKMLTDKGWQVRRIKIDDGCYEIDAKDHGISRSTIDDVRGGDAPENLRIMMSMLDGAKGPVRDIVMFNAASALFVGALRFPFLVGNTDSSTY